MFKKSFVYFFKLTCSAVASNLFAINNSNILTCGIIHQNKICLINGSDTTNLSHREIVCDDKINNVTSNDCIVYMKIIYVNEKPLLGIVKEECFSLYESNGSGIVFSCQTKDICLDAMFSCLTSVGDSLIIVGTDHGNFCLFEISKSGSIQFRESIVGHDSSLVCMNADSKWLTSADDFSVIQFWRMNNDATLDLVSKYSAPISDIVYPPTCLVALPEKRVSAVGFSNGKLCLFNCENGRLLADISAHSRLISDVAFKSDILITVSEDTVCRIWQVGSGSDLNNGDSPSASITLVQSIIIPDQMLQGVAFTNRKYLEFVISSYDSNELLSFSQTAKS